MLGKVIAAALQMETVWAGSEEGFRVHVACLLEDAKEQGAELVALPQYLGLCLLGTLGTATSDMSPLEVSRSAGYGSLAECYQAQGITLSRAYVEAGMELARQFRLYVAFGSTILTGEDGRLHDVAYLFEPGGDVIGTQQRTHLAPGQDEREWSRGDALSVFDTPVGRIGFVIGADIHYPEVSRILSLKGANVLVHLHCATHYSRADWMRRLWREVQANQVFGIESCMVGRGHLGRATIHAPLGMTPAGDGILAGASSTVRSEVVVVELDYPRLQQAVDAYPIYSALNYGMYRECFPAIYESNDVVGVVDTVK